jgi:general secretion pathway protein G
VLSERSRLKRIPRLALHRTASEIAVRRSMSQPSAILRQQSRLSRGFTLIELLVVLAILGMLAAIAVPQVLKYLGRAKEDVVKVQIQSLGTSLDLFLLDIGRYPTEQEGLQALVQKPPGLDGWKGPYVAKQSALIDPWGHPYVYKQPGQNGADYDLFSLGPDGRGLPSGNAATASASP